MLVASKVKMSGSEKKNGTYEHTTFPPRNVQLGSFTYVEVVQNRAKKCTKIVLHVQSFFFALKPY